MRLGSKSRKPRHAAIVVGTLALSLPLTASASAGPPPAVFRFATIESIIAIGLSVVFVAFLTNRFAPEKRRRMRQPAITALLYLASFSVTIVLRPLGISTALRVAHEFAEFFGLVTAVNVGALVLFDLGLSALGIRPAAFIGSLMVVIGNVAAVGLTLRNLGVEPSGILATSALITTITAFSLQGTLSNVVGGLALQMDDSIRVGDWVELENGRQGKVREIRWRYTVIETRNWDTMIVPNASILSGTVTILGKREGQPLQHRMWVYFNVDLGYTPTSVIEAVNKGLQASPIEGASTDPAPHAICMEFAKDAHDGMAIYAARYWLTDLARDDPTSSRVRERIYASLARASIPLTIPARRLLVDRDRPAQREGDEAQRRLAALSAVEFLRSLRDDERAHIAQRLTHAAFAPGEIITRQGAVAHWLYIILQGRAAVRIDSDGMEKQVAEVVGPSFVGEMGLMTGEPRSATIVALSEVECFRLDKNAFNQIMADRPEIAAEVSPVLARRAVELKAKREDLNAEAREKALLAEHRLMLAKVQRFFGLGEEAPRKPRAANP